MMRKGREGKEVQCLELFVQEHMQMKKKEMEREMHTVDDRIYK